MSQFNYILAGDGITVFVDGKSFTVNRSAKTFNLVLSAIKDNNLDALRQALDIRSNIVNSLNSVSSKVSICDGEILYGDRPVTGLIASRIFEMMELTLDVKPMVRFLENLMQNPSNRAVNELFGFLDACSLPITEDGYFLAYKRVREDYKDCYTGTLDNSVGQVLKMERNLVDENSQQTCSHGLHVCSYDYLQYFSGERIVVCKVNPRDVVSVPVDYNNSKMRVCEYTVVDEIPLVNYAPTHRITDYYTDEYSDLEDEEDDLDWDREEDWDDSWEDNDDEDDSSVDKLDSSVYEDLVIDLTEYVKNDGEQVTLLDIASWYEVSVSELGPLINKIREELASNDIEARIKQLRENNIAINLTDQQLNYILNWLDEGKSLAWIARESGFSARTIGRIKHCKR